MIEKILGSKTKTRILRKMFEQEREFWFKELAQSLNLSFGTVHPALSELVEVRILRAKKAGNSKLYSLNKSHPLFTELKNLFDEEREKPVKIAKLFARKIRKTHIRNIILFGSAARGEFKEKSDIDILIVYVNKKDEIDKSAYEIVSEMLEKYDIPISVTYISYSEMKQRIKKLDRFVVKLLEEGEILFGDKKWLKM